MVKNIPLRSLWEAERWSPKMSTPPPRACGLVLCCSARNTEDGLNKGLGWEALLDHPDRCTVALRTLKHGGRRRKRGGRDEAKGREGEGKGKRDAVHVEDAGRARSRGTQGTPQRGWASAASRSSVRCAHHMMEQERPLPQGPHGGAPCPHLVSATSHLQNQLMSEPYVQSLVTVATENCVENDSHCIKSGQRRCLWHNAPAAQGPGPSEALLPAFHVKEKCPRLSGPVLIG